MHGLPKRFVAAMFDKGVEVAGEEGFVFAVLARLLRCWGAAIAGCAATVGELQLVFEVLDLGIEAFDFSDGL